MNWLHHDHKHFESVVYKCRTACDAADWETAVGLLEQLASEYKSHIRMEEGVLFPAYEALPGVSTNPTASLKQDHNQIFRLFSHITQELKDGAYDNSAQNLSLLFRTLIRHHEKEEELFLPMASELLASKKGELLRRFNSADKSA